MALAMLVPVRVYPVFAGSGVDDPNRQTVVRCAAPADAEALAQQLEALRRAGALVPDDPQVLVTYFAGTADIDVAAASLDDVKGLTIRSVVLATADTPTDKVLATVVDGVLEPTPAPAVAVAPVS